MNNQFYDYTEEVKKLVIRNNEMVINAVGKLNDSLMEFSSMISATRVKEDANTSAIINSLESVRKSIFAAVDKINVATEKEPTIDPLFYSNKSPEHISNRANILINTITKNNISMKEIAADFLSAGYDINALYKKHAKKGQLLMQMVSESDVLYTIAARAVEKRKHNKHDKTKVPDEIAALIGTMSSSGIPKGSTYNRAYKLLADKYPELDDYVRKYKMQANCRTCNTWYVISKNKYLVTELEKLVIEYKKGV